MRFVLALLALSAAACATAAPEPPGPTAGKWKNTLNGVDLNADYCVKQQTTLADFFLANQMANVQCSQASFYEDTDGARMGMAQCRSATGDFVLQIRVAGDMTTSYTAQTVTAPLSTKPDFAAAATVQSTRIGDC